LRRKRVPSIPDEYLAYNFGWRPLVQDLTSMVGLAKSVQERIRQLKNRQKGGTERVALGNTRSISTYEMTLPLMPPTAPQKGHVVADVQQKYWAVLTFNGGSSLPVVPDADQIIDEMTRSLGLNLSYATLWEAIPWSWLIDYFSTVGDWLNAHRGLTSFNGTTLAVMAQVNYVDNAVNVTPGLLGVTFTGGLLSTTFKLREIRHNPTPTIIFEPFLSKRQVGILAALITAGRSARVVAS